MKVVRLGSWKVGHVQHPNFPTFQPRFFKVAPAVLALCAVACGVDNELGGSVSELFPLEISRVEVRRNVEALQVSYYNNRATEVDLVIRLDVSLRDVALARGTRIDLAGEYAPGHQRTTVAHMAGGEPLKRFPKVKNGDLHLNEGGNPEELTRGDFSMSFEQDQQFGSGRTLVGRFTARARDAGFEQLP